MFSFLYYVWVPLTLPSTLMTLFGSFVFAKMYGPYRGFVVTVLAIWLSHPLAALGTFLMARCCLQTYIRNKMINRIRVFKAMDSAFQTEGLKLAFLLRVQPVFPWNMLNYVLAVTSCTPWHNGAARVHPPT